MALYGYVWGGEKGPVVGGDGNGYEIGGGGLLYWGKGLAGSKILSILILAMTFKKMTL